MYGRNVLRFAQAVAGGLLLSACASGVAGAIGSSVIGNALDIGNHRLIEGNYNLVSIGGHDLPAQIPSSWVNTPPCPAASITTSRVTAGQMVLERTSSRDSNFRGNLKLSTTTEVTCRGQNSPRVVNEHIDGRYRVITPEGAYDLVEIYFPQTDATRVLKRRGRNLVLDPQEYVFRKGGTGADTTRT